MLHCLYCKMNEITCKPLRPLYSPVKFDSLSEVFLTDPQIQSSFPLGNTFLSPTIYLSKPIKVMLLHCTVIYLFINVFLSLQLDHILLGMQTFPYEPLYL